MSNAGGTRREGTVFAGTILVVNGIFGLVQGLVALLGPDSYYAVIDGELFLFDIAGWGWWNVIIGALVLLTALALLNGASWARIVAIVLAVLSAVVQLLLIPVQPWWSFIVIAIDVLIIYSLTAHGEERRRA